MQLLPWLALALVACAVSLDACPAAHAACARARDAERDAERDARRHAAELAQRHPSAGYYYYSTGTVEVYTAAVVESGFVREWVPSFLHAHSYFKGY